MTRHFETIKKPTQKDWCECDQTHGPSDAGVYGMPSHSLCTYTKSRQETYNTEVII